MNITIIELKQNQQSTIHIEMQQYQPLMSTQELSILVDCVHIPWDRKDA